MRHVPALARRELASYFLRPTAYFVLLGFQLIAGLDFFQLVELLSDPRQAVSFSGRLDPMASYVAGNWLFWMALLVAVPALTMRMIAEERRTGTIEGLLTAPVAESEIVVGKWLAGLVMYLALLAPFALYLPFLVKAGGYPLEVGPLVSLLVGLTSLGALLVAVGLFFSAITRNQVEAAIGTFVTLLALLLVPLLQGVFGTAPGWSEGVAALSIYYQLNDFAVGRLDLRVVAMHLSAAAFLLFLATKVTDARRGL